MEWLAVLTRSDKIEAPLTNKPLTAYEKEYIQDTWRHILVDPLENGKKIFRRLFEQHPAVMHKFYFAARNKFDIEKIMVDVKLESHARSVVKTITMAINSMDNLGGLVSALMDLGGKHAKFNPSEEDFQAVGEALIWTLEDCVGDRFNENGKRVWLHLYDLVATTMLQGIQRIKTKSK